jgi:hypothetical protein
MKTTDVLPKDAIASIDDPTFTTASLRDHADDAIVRGGDDHGSEAFYGSDPGNNV